jgi:hypothetical protein
MGKIINGGYKTAIIIKPSIGIEDDCRKIDFKLKRHLVKAHSGNSAFRNCSRNEKD